MHAKENRSDDISGGNQIGSDTFEGGSDIIRYPTIILSPGGMPLAEKNIGYRKVGRAISKGNHCLLYLNIVSYGGMLRW